MATTSGNMNTLKVTGKDGNVFVMTPVDTEARQAIDEAKNLQFDDDYFTAEVSQDQSTVSVGLNGVPIGVSSPLRFDQDTAQGIVIGIDTSSVTPPEMTGATASADGASGLVPAPLTGDQGKFLKGDGTWTTIEIAEQKVHVLTKTTGLTTAEFEQAWSWLENGHLVGVWYTYDDYTAFYLVDKYYTYFSTQTEYFIVFSYTRPGSGKLENQNEGFYRDKLSWRKSNNSSLTHDSSTIIPTPLNQFNKYLFTDGRGGALIWKTVREVPSSAVADSGKVLTVNAQGSAAWDSLPVFAGTSNGVVNAPASANRNHYSFLDGMGDWSMLEEVSESSINGMFLSVTIGDREYKVVQIGNQLWMAENLDYAFDYEGNPLPVGGSGTTSTPAAWYYNNSSTDYGIDGTYKCGLLYNWHAVKYLDDNKATLLPSGWHVPTTTELTTLVNTIGTDPGTKLKAVDNYSVQGFPDGWGGTDTYGFKMLPTGAYNGNFQGINQFGCLLAIDEQDAAHSKFLSVGRSSGSSFENNYKTYAYSVRLVKDAT